MHHLLDTHLGFVVACGVQIAGAETTAPICEWMGSGSVRLWHVVISGDDVCCSVVFGTLVGVFSVMWYELLMTFAISCPLWSSVCECHKMDCAFTSPVRTECGMFVICCMYVSAVL